MFFHENRFYFSIEEVALLLRVARKRVPQLICGVDGLVRRPVRARGNGGRRPNTARSVLKTFIGESAVLRVYRANIESLTDSAFALTPLEFTIAVWLVERRIVVSERFQKRTENAGALGVFEIGNRKDFAVTPRISQFVRSLNFKEAVWVFDGPPVEESPTKAARVEPIETRPNRLLAACACIECSGQEGSTKKNDRAGKGAVRSTANGN
jgi:hypothetical protein